MNKTNHRKFTQIGRLLPVVFLVTCLLPMGVSAEGVTATQNATQQEERFIPQEQEELVTVEGDGITAEDDIAEAQLLSDDPAEDSTSGEISIEGETNQLINVPAQSYTVTAANVTTTDVPSQCTVYGGWNLNNVYTAYHRYGLPVKSALVAVSEGYMRFQAISFDVNTNEQNDFYLAEYYDTSFQLQKTVKVPKELPVYGGFYTDGENYYLLTGQNNQNEDDSVEVYRITKYDSSWNRLGSCGLYGANTYIPFDAGSARMIKSGKWLLIRTCHTMYQSSDGKHHQANVTIEVDTDNMTVTDSYTGIMNWRSGYVSHSFDQFILADGNHVVGLDLGDANPRSVALLRYGTDFTTGEFIGDAYYVCGYVPMLNILGNYGDNDTGVELGGFEMSDDNYLAAGCAVDMTTSAYSAGNTRNIFVSALSRSLNPDYATVHQITTYPEGDSSPYAPQLVQITGDSFLLLWMKDDLVHYTLIDGAGNRVGTEYTMEGSLSDCKPLVSGNQALWYTWNEGLVTFYSVKLNDLANPHKYVSRNGQHDYIATTNAQENEEYRIKEVCSRCGKEKYVDAFWDVRDTSAWYYIPVYWAREHEVTSGENARRFGVNSTCTREQIVTFLYKAYGEPEVTDYTRVAKFKDVGEGKYYYDAVAWAVNEGITSGVTEDTFGVGRPCTRAQAMQFLYKAEGGPQAQGTGQAVSFQDVASGSWYEAAVKWGVSHSITGGKSATLFGVNDPCTRAQIVTFIFKTKR